METVELQLRGTDLETMKSYLGVLGGVEQADGQIAGEGWRVRLTPGVHTFKQWDIPRVTLNFEGESDRLAEITQKLRVMAMRSGG